MPPKTKCPVTKEQFLKHAKPIPVKLPAGVEVTLQPKAFSTGSFGWYCGRKVDVMVGDEEVQTQLQIMMTAVGSKDLES